MLAAAVGVMVGMRNAVALTPTRLGLRAVFVSSRRPGAAGVQGERSSLMACAKVCALGPVGGQVQADAPRVARHRCRHL